MKRPEPAVTLPFLVPYYEGTPLVDHVRELRPLTDLVIPLKTRQALDRVLAENLFTMHRPARTDFKGNPQPPESIDFRVIVRHFRHVAIQYRVGDHWESPTFFSEMTADAILAMVFQRMVPRTMQQEPALDESHRVMTYQMPPWNFR